MLRITADERQHAKEIIACIFGNNRSKGALKPSIFLGETGCCLDGGASTQDKQRCEKKS
jgi:hypothetical protein